MELRVPDQARAALKLLAQWPSERVQKFAVALEHAKPTLVLADFSATVSTLTEISRAEVVPLIESLASIHTLVASTAKPKEEVVVEICAHLAESKEFKELPDFNLGIFKNTLLLLLSFENTLGVTAKAVSVLTDHTNVFRACRILTDIRPIFGANPDSTPAAAMVVHSVNFIVRRLDRLEEIFIALDSLDLQKLKALIQRAELKEKSLRSLVENAKVQYLEPKP